MVREMLSPATSTFPEVASISMSKDSRSTLILLLVAAVWGFAFVAQSRGMAALGVFTFNGVRFALGGIVLLPWLLWRGRSDGSRTPSWATVRPGLLIGLVLFCATTLQTQGMSTTPAGKAAFITGLFIAFVPLTGTFLGRKVPWNAWIGCGICLVGLDLLCLKSGLRFDLGEILVLASTVLWTVQILLIDHFASREDPAWIAFWQFFACAALSLLAAVLLEPWGFRALPAAWFSVFYGGVFSVGLGYTLQIVGQKDVPAARAAIVLSLETVFAAFGGWLLLGERMGPRELCGCALMLIGMVASQLSPRRAS
jgi:drug/metabolite transporter (DMT)-like permease